MEVKAWTYEEFPGLAEPVAGAHCVVTTGADHGGPEFFAPQMIDVYDAFVQRCAA